MPPYPMKTELLYVVQPIWRSTRPSR